MSIEYPFCKGHGTRNDFVLLPDHDGAVHGELAAERVRALCDRRGGIGGDGVLRVIRTSALADGAEHVPDADAEWFMDYRNSDGSFSEMCGNGIRVFALHLVREGMARVGEEQRIGTRDGVKLLTVHDEQGERITADMGSPKVFGTSQIAVGERTWTAQHVDMGNPHAVAFVDDLADAGALTEPPSHDDATYPDGVNVEFVVRRGPAHVGMRVHERGSGETLACGTGACAVMVAAATQDGAARETDYRVDQPGGPLTIRWTAEDRILMTGPAEIIAEGTTSL